MGKVHKNETKSCTKEGDEQHPWFGCVHQGFTTRKLK